MNSWSDSFTDSCTRTPRITHYAGWSLVLLTLGCGALWAASSARSSLEDGKGREKTAVLVELFTSEGCSSCPPADRVLSQLVADQPVAGAQIIGLGEHVDYWDGLGWKDPFSDREFTKRQQYYAQAFRSSNIYTPQMIVDGREEFVGSDRRKAIAAIQNSLSEERVRIDLEISPDTPSQLKIVVGERPPSRSGKSRVMLAVTEMNLHSEVSRGENRGLQLDHSSVVRQLTQVGEIDAGRLGPYSTAAKLDLSNDWKIGDLSLVVFVQRVDDLRILGATTISVQPAR